MLCNAYRALRGSEYPVGLWGGKNPASLDYPTSSTLQNSNRV